MSIIKTEKYVPIKLEFLKIIALSVAFFIVTTACTYTKKTESFSHTKNFVKTDEAVIQKLIFKKPVVINNILSLHLRKVTRSPEYKGDVHYKYEEKLQPSCLPMGILGIVISPLKIIQNIFIKGKFEEHIGRTKNFLFGKSYGKNKVGEIVKNQQSTREYKVKIQPMNQGLLEVTVNDSIKGTYQPDSDGQVLVPMDKLVTKLPSSPGIFQVDIIATLEDKDARKSMLMTATKEGYIKIVRILSDKNTDINTKDEKGWTVLMASAKKGYIKAVKALLNKGADVNAKSNEGMTALMMAAKKGHTAIVLNLLNKGAEANAKSNDGITALMWGAMEGHAAVVLALLNNGADIRAKTKIGMTALMYAAEKGHTETFNLLSKSKEKSYGIQAIKSISSNVSPPPNKLTSSPKRPNEFLYTKITGRRWAVIIGISNYNDSRIPGLRYASADAQAFYDWAVSADGGKYAPSRVKLLLDKDATGEKIKAALYVWLKQALAEDVVTIYFAGHGSPESPDSPDNLFLLPYDTKYDSIATTGFPMWDIETALKRFIKAKKVVMIADACHAGGVGQAYDIARRADRNIEVNPISAGLQNLSQVGDGICVISASDDKQYSQESKDWGGGHGVFTYFLLKGLKGEADYNKDDKVTLGEIIPYLSEQVRRATKNAQSPTVAGKFDPALSIGR